MALSEQVFDDAARDLEVARAAFRCKTVMQSGNDFKYNVPGVGEQSRAYTQAEKDACAADLTAKLGTFKTNVAAITE